MHSEASRRRQVLLVEDDVSVSASLDLCLHAYYEIHVASTVRSGIDLFDALGPSLVVLDLQLPDGKGLGVLRKIRCKSTTTPVVVLTGYASLGTAEEALRLGASDYLHKPFDPFSLKSRIDELLLVTRQKASSRRGAGVSLAVDSLRRAGISPREREVLYWVAQGKRDLEIATILSISVRTVHHHVSSILGKLGVETRTAAVALASSELGDFD